MLAADTKPVRARVVEAFASAVGTPKETVSPSAAPVAVMVNDWQLFPAITGKSKEAAAEICLEIEVPPPITKLVELAVPSI